MPGRVPEEGRKLPMRASWSSWVGLTLACLLVPSIAAADPLLPDAVRTARWALPLFIADALLLAVSAFGLAAVGWNRLGFVLWLVCVSAGGFLFVYGMPHALNDPRWQLPAFMAGVAVLLVVAELARKRLADE